MSRADAQDSDPLMDGEIDDSLERDEGRAGSLPSLVTRFVGRHDEIAAIVTLLAEDDVRLVTLVGPGGVGKTRLALAIASRPEYAGRVRFVSLTAITDPALIPQAIMRALGLEAVPGAPIIDVLVGSLGQTSLLLVVDNLEHVVEGVTVLAELLQRCRGLRLLATSRIPLDLSGEHVIRVQPLALPSRMAKLSMEAVAEAAAIQLFVDLAHSVMPSFQLSAANAEDVVEICRRLDGLPLAIELAAARSAQFAPRLLRERLGRRLTVLEPSMRDTPRRQRTLRDAVEWSVDLLPDLERTLWRWLGICDGGFTMETAECFAPVLAVDPEMIAPMVDMLVRQSLLVQGNDSLGEPRFFMLETTRSIANEAMQQESRREEVWAAFSDRLQTFCRDAEPGLMGPESGVWFARVEAELPGIRAVLARERLLGRRERALHMVGDIGWFWSDPVYVAEGRSWIEPLLAAHGDVASRSLAKAVGAAGMLAGWHNDHERARIYAKQALDLWRDIGDHARIAESAINLGNVELDLQRYPQADALFRDAEEHARLAGDVWLMAAAANLRGVVAQAEGRYRDAVRWHEAALSGWEAAGFPGHAMSALQSLGWTRLEMGDTNGARNAYLRMLELGDDLVNLSETPLALMGAALLAHREGRDALATRLLSTALRERSSLGLPFRPVIQRAIDEVLSDMRDSLGESAYARAWSDGRAASYDAMILLARSVLREGEAKMAPLSPREREVLELLIDGSSDEEIAQQLSISHRTVSRHVGSILGKLGAPNRTAAATIAARQGVI